MTPEQVQAAVDLLPYAYRIADRITGREDDEARSEAHLALLAAIESFDPAKAPEGNLRGWVRFNVRREVYRYLRKEAARKRRERQYDSPWWRRRLAEPAPEAELPAVCDVGPNDGPIRDLRIVGATIREIAEELGLDKSYVVRRISAIRARRLREPAA